MTKSAYASLLMGLIYELKFEVKFIDQNAEIFWKKWQWVKALKISAPLDYLYDIEKMFITLLAEFLNLSELEMHRIYKEKF